MLKISGDKCDRKIHSDVSLIILMPIFQINIEININFGSTTTIIK